MEVKDFLEALDPSIELILVNANHNLIYHGLTGDLFEADFPKTYKSKVLKILEIKNNYLELLIDYIF